MYSLINTIKIAKNNEEIKATATINFFLGLEGFSGYVGLSITSTYRFSFNSSNLLGLTILLKLHIYL